MSYEKQGVVHSRTSASVPEAESSVQRQTAVGLALHGGRWDAMCPL